MPFVPRPGSLAEGTVPASLVRGRHERRRRDDGRGGERGLLGRVGAGPIGLEGGPMAGRGQLAVEAVDVAEFLAAGRKVRTG